MPELTTIQPGRLFGIRMFKRMGDRYWVNTYELQYQGTDIVSDGFQLLEDTAELFRNAEVVIHASAVTIDRAVVSSVEPDGTPYDPETFAVFNYNIQGSGITGAYSMLPLSFCVLVKKAVNFGRSGNILYRGALSTASGSMGPAGFSLNNTTIDRIQNALNTLTDGLNLLNVRLVLVKLNDDGTVDNVRNVESVSVRGLTTTKKLYNRYFDQADNSTGGN